MSDQSSMAKKIDPRDAAAKKAADEATKRALEKKKLEDAKAKEAAGKKSQEVEGAAKKKAAEEAAAKKAAEEAAAKKAEEVAIANMKDPIQDLFLQSIKAYSTTGGLQNADKSTQAELEAELNRVAKQFGGSDGEDMTQFPSLDFSDPEVEKIDVSSGN